MKEVNSANALKAEPGIPGTRPRLTTMKRQSSAKLLTTALLVLFAVISPAQVPVPGTESAIAAATARIRANPRDANAYITRAAYYLKPLSANMKPPLPNVEAAVSDLETALKLDPRNFYGRHNYAQAAYLLGFYDYAVAEYSKAINLNPHSGRSYLGRGWAHHELCQFNDAAVDFDRAVRQDPSLWSKVANQQATLAKKEDCSRPPAPSQAAPPRRGNCVGTCIYEGLRRDEAMRYIGNHPGATVGEAYAHTSPGYSGN